MFVCSVFCHSLGLILEVSEGTLTPAGVGRGAKDDQCVYGEAGQKLGNYPIFKVGMSAF